MTSYRIAVLAALAAGATACAGNAKAVKPTTDIVDGAPAASTAAPVATSATVPDTSRQSDAATSTCEPARVHFAFDSTQLDAASRASLQESAKCVADRKAAGLLVEGHCDERGTEAYNVALGARRAEMVKRYLTDLGVKAKIDTVSFGEEMPLVQGSNEKAWAENRRAELRLPGEKGSDGSVVAIH